MTNRKHVVSRKFGRTFFLCISRGRTPCRPWIIDGIGTSAILRHHPGGPSIFTNAFKAILSAAHAFPCEGHHQIGLCLSQSAPFQISMHAILEGSCALRDLVQPFASPRIVRVS